MIASMQARQRYRRRAESTGGIGKLFVPFPRPPIGVRLIMAALPVVLVLAFVPHAWAQGSEPRLLIPTPGGTPSAPAVPTVPSAPSVPVAPVQPGGAVVPAPPAAAPNPAVARLEARMTQLEQDLRTVTGRLEDVSFQLRKLSDRLDKLASDTDYRLDQAGTADAGSGKPAPRSDAGGGLVEAGPAAGAASNGRSSASADADTGKSRAPAPPASANGSQQTASLPPKSAREQYARAFALMEKQNYEEAATGFSDFLKANPDDPLVDNARYWLGETYYARAEYARAAEIFLENYDKNKTGPKAPDTLLKLGLSLAALDKKKEACASFRELNRAFPNAPAAVKDKAGQEGKRLSCS